jgi:hypothetical protein
MELLRIGMKRRTFPVSAMGQRPHAPQAICKNSAHLFNPQEARFFYPSLTYTEDAA